MNIKIAIYNQRLCLPPFFVALVSNPVSVSRNKAAKNISAKIEISLIVKFFPRLRKTKTKVIFVLSTLKIGGSHKNWAICVTRKFRNLRREVIFSAHIKIFTE